MAPESRDEVRQRIDSLYDQAENATGNYNATRAMTARTRTRGVPLRKRPGGRGDPALDEVARQWFDVARAKLGPTVPAVLPADRMPERPAADRPGPAPRDAAGRSVPELPPGPAGRAVAELTGGPLPALPAGRPAPALPGAPAPEPAGRPLLEPAAGPVAALPAVPGQRREPEPPNAPAPPAPATGPRRPSPAAAKESNRRKLAAARELLTAARPPEAAATAFAPRAEAVVAAIAPRPETVAVTEFAPRPEPVTTAFGPQPETVATAASEPRPEGMAVTTFAPRPEPVTTAFGPQPETVAVAGFAPRPAAVVATAIDPQPGAMTAAFEPRPEGMAVTAFAPRPEAAVPSGAPGIGSPVGTEYVVPAAAGGRAAQAVAFARAQIGRPCVWGATGPDSYDYAGLTQAAWKAAGVSLPRSAQEQALAGTPVALTGIRGGDLVFFFDNDSHVGIYVGDGMMVHAPGPGSAVREESVYGAGESAIHRVVRPA